MSDGPEARVEVGPNGELVLHDPAAAGMIAAVEAHNLKIAMGNLREFMKANHERLDYFVTRMRDRRMSPREAVVTCIQVDDPFGGQLADALMPGHDWQAIRDQGLEPVARGLAMREGIEEILSEVYPNVGANLKSAEGYVAVVVGFGTALIATLKDPEPWTVWERLQHQ